MRTMHRPHRTISGLSSGFPCRGPRIGRPLQRQVSHGGAFDFDFSAVGAEFLVRPSGSPSRRKRFERVLSEKEAAPDCPAITWRLFSPCDTMLTLSRHSAIRESALMSATAVQFSSLSLNVMKHIENC
jgi:hypothetical protein